jgi:hypothetical protein
MNESEFRDWCRAQLRLLDERIKAVAARPVEPAKIEVDGRISGAIAELEEGLRKRVMEKKIAGLAIAFVTVDGAALNGYAAAGDTFFKLAGATNLVGLEVLEGFRQAEAEAIAREGHDADQPA